MKRIWLLALLAGCLDVAEHRAWVDSQVGRGTAGARAVEVEGGLAAIRDVRAGALDLWANAPVLVVHLGPGAAETFLLRVRNVALDARLEAPAMQASMVEPGLWRIDLPDRAVTVRIGAPDAAQAGPFRFGAFADVQEAIGRVDDVFHRMNADPDLRFVVMAGDLTEMGSPAELERFERALAGLRVPLYATLGNHELGGAEDNFHRRFGRGSAHFVFRGVHFTLLDSASATIAPATSRWLEGWLDEGRDGLHALFMHIAPLDPVGVRNGAFASRAEAVTLVSRFARAGVDLTIYGHVHSYYSFSNAGIPAFISGGGGAIPERLDGIGRHFLVVDADPGAQRFSTRVVRVD